MELLAGLGIAGYRSFGHAKLQNIAPLSKVTLVAGQNNTGKSNLLRFIQRALQRNGAGNFSALDAPAGPLALDREPRFAVGHTLLETRERIDQLADQRGHGGNPIVRELADALQAALSDNDSNSLLWVQYVFDSKRRSRELDDEWLIAATSRAGNRRSALQNGSSWLANMSGGNTGDDLKHILSALWPTERLPPVQTIPAFRQVQHAIEGEELSFNGVGLVERLAQLESPSAIDHGERERFESIQHFVRDVLDDPGLTITVPYQRDTINVRLSGGAVLPLEHMGTGIHEVVILATAATLLTDSLVCVEEPEIHLHPLLQRKLLRYIERATTNQYIIATHSASMLDAEIASIFHITLDDAGSRIDAASTPGARARICADLGYRASDLVQANAVIWVEGPSDRIYLKRWLEIADARIVEGIDYSIMFYGGRLLNHLTAEDPDVEDFISLRRLNRHVAILIDSDKTSPQARVNATKRRVVDEIGPEGVAWVTAGYTVENYIPDHLLRSAIGTVHRRAVLGETARYSNPLASPALVGVKSADKLAIARAVAESWSDDTIWPLDLRARVDEIVRFIHRANGITAAPGA